MGTGDESDTWPPGYSDMGAADTGTGGVYGVTTGLAPGTDISEPCPEAGEGVVAAVAPGGPGPCLWAAGGVNIFNLSLSFGLKVQVGC